MNGMKPYRKYKCIVQWVDENDMTNKVHSTERVINLADVIDYEKFKSPRFTDNVERTLVHIGINKPSIVIKESFKNFEAVHDKFCIDFGMLDDRSLKKKPLIKNLPVKFHFLKMHDNYIGYVFGQNHDPNFHTREENFEKLVDKYESTFN